MASLSTRVGAKKFARIIVTPYSKTGKFQKLLSELISTIKVQ